MKTTITFEIDTSGLETIGDRSLAALWHIAQANPAPHADAEAGCLVMDVSMEIVRRWLKDAPIDLWHHCSTHHYHKILTDHGSWPGPKHDTWVPNAGAAAGWQLMELRPEVQTEIVGMDAAGRIRAIQFVEPLSDAARWLTIDDQDDFVPVFWMPLPDRHEVLRELQRQSGTDKDARNRGGT
ncbi:MAG: hypothetical protein F9K29_07885 [Hyphomicrobiaceae bacterium]|nr:MAG: hypothetical protein F9K29_07885 [Hyphomicrobiaceae bacterium]